MDEKKSMVATGSMLNSSEGLLSTGAMAALVQALTTASGPWEVASTALALAVVAAVYCTMRSRVKCAEASA